MEPERLRFDFTHGAPLTTDQLRAVEAAVDRAVRTDAPVTVTVEPRDVAIRRGALALFGDKYGEAVRTVEVFPPPPRP